MRQRLGVLALLAFGVLTSTGACSANSASEQRDDSPSRVDPVSNKIVITSQNVILWNGRPVTA